MSWGYSYKLDIPTPMIRGISAMDYSAMIHLWSLEPKLLTKLTMRTTHYCSLTTFMDYVIEEEYPISYSDVFCLGGKRYYITYIECSGAFLSALEEEAGGGETTMLFQLRYQKDLNISRCLVKIANKNWTEESLIQHGACKFPGVAVVEK